MTLSIVNLRGSGLLLSACFYTLEDVRIFSSNVMVSWFSVGPSLKSSALKKKKRKLWKLKILLSMIWRINGSFHCVGNVRQAIMFLPVGMGKAWVLISILTNS